MKTKPSLLFGKTALFLALGLLLTSLPARATLLFSGVDLGAAGRTTQWAAFALSGGITATDTTSQVIPTIEGNIGVAANSITISGTTKVLGSAYIKTGGTLNRSGAAFVTGNGGLPLQGGANDTLVNQAKADAIAASAAANLLIDNQTGVTQTGTWNSQVTVNQNISLGLSDTSGAHVVLHLTDFVLTGGATFTLDGVAATTYVINVANNFSLVGGKVLLTGGIGPENVLFNIVGAGSNISLSALAQYNGFILAPSRTINVTGASKVNGTIVAGKVSISGGSKIKKPTYISP